MTAGRLAAIIFVFLCVTVAWVILGSSVTIRTKESSNLGQQVAELWGGEHEQFAPQATFTLPNHKMESLELASSDIRVNLGLDQRRKGLLWYDTYNVAFDALYTLNNPQATPITATVAFKLPSSNAIYDDFQLLIGEESVSPQGSGGELTGETVLPPNGKAEIRVIYKSRGMDRWVYRFDDDITTVKNFVLTVNTDFADYDFPQRTISASTKTRTEQGWQLQWQFASLVSDFGLGVEMPHKLNPGPLASRMSYFAPVSLLFFFTVLVVLGMVKGVSLHPMHYFYLGTGFFAFHLLFAYLVDHVIVELAFAIAALVSMLLVVSYLWRAVGRRYALREAGLSQFIFLVLFSYAFFFEGYTGLVVTIGAILTLAALMQLTARVDWAEAFRKKPAAPKDKA